MNWYKKAEDIFDQTKQKLWEQTLKESPEYTKFAPQEVQQLFNPSNATAKEIMESMVHKDVFEEFTNPNDEDELEYFEDDWGDMAKPDDAQTCIADIVNTRNHNGNIKPKTRFVRERLIVLLEQFDEDYEISTEFGEEYNPEVKKIVDELIKDLNY